jgi:hypothetical protein
MHTIPQSRFPVISARVWTPTCRNIRFQQTLDDRGCFKTVLLQILLGMQSFSFRCVVAVRSLGPTLKSRVGGSDAVEQHLN